VLEHNFAPDSLIECVKQVKIYVVGLQLFKLLIQIPVEIIGALDEPHREFGRDLDSFAIAILQGFANHYLALPFVVRIGGIEIVDAILNRMANHAYGFWLVDLGTVALAIERGKTHATKAEGRGLPIKGSKIAELHVLALFRNLEWILLQTTRRCACPCACGRTRFCKEAEPPQNTISVTTNCSSQPWFLVLRHRCSCS
jgi:hypothetical protein